MEAMKDSMKNLKRTKSFLAVLVCLLAIAAFIFPRLRKQSSPVQAQRPSMKTFGEIPPAPPRRTTEPLASAATKPKQMPKVPAVDSSRLLQYDVALSFEANLERLKRFCDEHKAEADLETLIAGFIETAIQQSKDHFAGVRSALERDEGPPIYKNMLLACLMSADGPVETKGTLVWDMATNQNQQASVRRTAAYLSGQIDSGTKRPDAFRRLLTDPDEQVVVFALTITNRNINLDQANYDLIKTSLLTSTNINLQVAAVNAIGKAPFADSQSILISIVTNAQTSGAEPFSEATLAKRSAIMLLDPNSSEIQQLLYKTAFDDAEDPGVRAKAITRMATSETPEVTRSLQTLLNQLNDDNLVPLRAVVDALVAQPTAANITLVQERISRIKDPQIHTVLLHRVEMATEGDNP
jgi:hypothetical protein